MIRPNGWERFDWLRAGFSIRAGGCSYVYGPDELNLGWTVEDDEARVLDNRARLLFEVSGGEAMELVTARQVHGATTRRIAGVGPWSGDDGRALLVADGLMTAEAGKLIGIQTADCVPILIADTRLRVVAAFHAGWKGTAARIMELGVGAMQSEFGSAAADLVAAIGPAIGPCCFEVGNEVADAFRTAFAYGSELVSKAGLRPHVDLWEANRRQLMDAGVPAATVSVIAECTACAKTAAGRRKYFSHRAERGVTGRMMSVVGMAAGARDAQEGFESSRSMDSR